MIIYKGPSQIDGKPIVAIAITSSKNRKTGDMIQTYILREDIDPIEANRTGEDFSICGNCTLRGTPTERKTGVAANRKCYVQIPQAPLGIYKAYKRGIYPVATNEQIREVARGRMVRVGSYGDGKAVPRYVWDLILSNAEGHTAYTHNEADADLFMVSVESLAAAKDNWSNGHRTFRIIKEENELQKNEILCPSDRGVKCVDCKLCSGSSTKAKSIAILPHGSGKWLF